MRSVPKNGSGRNLPKSKMVVTWSLSGAVARVAYGQPVDGGGWRWESLPVDDQALTKVLGRVFMNNFTPPEPPPSGTDEPEWLEAAP